VCSFLTSALQSGPASPRSLRRRAGLCVRVGGGRREVGWGAGTESGVIGVPSLVVLENPRHTCGTLQDTVAPESPPTESKVKEVWNLLPKRNNLEKPVGIQQKRRAKKSASDKSHLFQHMKGYSPLCSQRRTKPQQKKRERER
jgi:hypothetical protein